VKRSDIKPGVDYAVGVAYRTQALGDQGVARAVLAVDPGVQEQSGEVRVRFTEPPQWGSQTRNVPTRKVLGTWADHEAAAAAREESDRRLAEAVAKRNAELAAAREQIVALIGEDPFAREYGGRVVSLDPETLLRLLRLANVGRS
jgi:hypothetical protein